MYLKKTLNRWAKQTGFILRRKALSAYDFLILMSIGGLAMKHPSLAGMVDALESKMSREALHQKFTSQAVAFLKKCLESVLKQHCNEIPSLESKLLKPFERILIFDSSSWDIHSNLRKVFPGSGGDASTANCKLQTAYEYKKAHLCFFDLTEGTRPDNSYSVQLPAQIRSKDLVLIDLGYFRLDTFHQIEQKKAFFLSRYRLGTILKDAESTELIDLENKLKHTSENLCEMKVILGNQKPVHCRLICLRVSQPVADQRRRRLHQQARKKGCSANRSHLILCDWILMLTNVPETLLPAKMVRPFYSLRWQIELLFKQFKSVLQIHQSDTANENRLKCQIYGKLIAAVLIHQLHGALSIPLWNTQRKELSMEKFHKRFQERAFHLLDCLLISVQQAVLYLTNEITRILDNCIKIDQPSRPTTLQILDELLNPVDKIFTKYQS